MIAQSADMRTALETMRQRAVRLEEEAVALRSDLDEMAILLHWQDEHSISPDALQKIVISDSEITNYRQVTGAQFPDAALRLTLQAQKVATWLKRSMQPEEKATAIKALIQAFNNAASTLGLTIPSELEAVIGD